jgi:RPE2 domain-containing protein
VPITISAILLLLTLAGMANYLPNINYLLHSLAAPIIFYILMKDWAKLKNALTEFKGEVIFVLLVTILYSLYTRDAILSVYDEMTYWGMATKELFLNGGFDKTGALTSIIPAHAHHPKGPAIYHYFMLFGAGYSEPGVLMAHFILHMLFLSPLLGNIVNSDEFDVRSEDAKPIGNRRETSDDTCKFISIDYIASLVSIFSILTVSAGLSLYTYAYRGIYNDGITGLIFSSALAVYLLESHKVKALFGGLVIVTFLPFFREIGFVLALLAGLFIY